MNNNYITLKQLATLASELNMFVGILDDKLKASGIKVVKSEPMGFRSRRRHMLELY